VKGVGGWIDRGCNIRKSVKTKKLNKKISPTFSLIIQKKKEGILLTSETGPSDVCLKDGRGMGINLQKKLLRS